MLAVVGMMVAVGFAVVPVAGPNLVRAMRENPLAPVLVAVCWIVATTASITGKRIISTGHLRWSDATAAHIGGTVANRVVPAGVGAAGVFLGALRRGGASTTVAAGVVALWAVAGALAHATGLLFGAAWLRGGWASLAIAVTAVGAVLVIGPLIVRRVHVRSAVPSPEDQAIEHSPVHQITAFQPAASLPEAMRLPHATPLGQPIPVPQALPPVQEAPLPQPCAPRTMRERAAFVAATARDVVCAARARPSLAAAAVTAQLVATLSLAVGFATAAASFDVQVTIAVAMASYLAGTALSAATPTPAGIGSAEAALVGALVVSGVRFGEALPAVLLFRAVILLAPIVAAALIALAWVTVGRLIRGQRIDAHWVMQLPGFRRAARSTVS